MTFIPLEEVTPDTKIGGYAEMLELDQQREEDSCSHTCTSNCRREGCNCECGEWHGSEELDFSGATNQLDR